MVRISGRCLRPPLRLPERRQAAKEVIVIPTRSSRQALQGERGARPLKLVLWAMVIGSAVLTGCSHLHRPHPSAWHLPWHHPPAGPEPLVNELVVEAGAGAAAPVLPQTWDRNALRIDMAAVTGEGVLTLRPLQGHDWPIRLEFGVQPGSFGHLEIRGEQRVILAVAASGAVSTLAVPQGTYAPATKELVIHYGP